MTCFSEELKLFPAIDLFNSNESLRTTMGICYSPISIGEINYNNVLVYPNPATDFIIFHSDNETHNVQLFNQIGEEVLNFRPNETVSISFLSSGVYYVKFRGGNFTKKLLIK